MTWEEQVSAAINNVSKQHHWLIGRVGGIETALKYMLMKKFDEDSAFGEAFCEALRADISELKERIFSAAEDPDGLLAVSVASKIEYFETLLHHDYLGGGGNAPRFQVIIGGKGDS